MSRLNRCCALALLALAACSAGPIESADPAREQDPDHHHDALELAATTSSSTLICVDPPEPKPPTIIPPIPTTLPSLKGSLIDGGQRVEFSPAIAERARVRVALGDRDTGSTYVDLKLAGRTVRVQRAPIKVRDDGKLIYLSTDGQPFSAVELRASYEFRGTGSTRSLGVSDLRVVLDGTAGPVDGHAPKPTFTDTPGSCEEQALLGFGPLPWDMPYLKFPEIQGCSETRCRRLADAWVHLHLNVWRANQMIEVLDSFEHDAQRSYFWNQPGTDADGNAVTIETSPAFWFGKWDKERYSAIREVLKKYWDIVLERKVIETKLRFICPDYSSNPGNICFSTAPLAHHSVPGYVNFCSSVFDPNEDGCSDPEFTLHESVHHEPLHHTWVHLDGPKFLKDTITHWHGAACTSATTNAIYCRNNVEHMLSYGDSCNHLDKLARTVDVYAMFTRRIGDMVYAGTMTHWPKPTDPTPQPPECEGEVGCLCPDAGISPPDGDYSTNHACDDDGGEIVCMKKKFNASSTVGICNDCSELRGPGCSCNDLTQPCDQGFCWGDDTKGESSATGTCYMDPPPDWGCLADCEELLGNGAFCMHDHPDHARCVPYGTTLPEAFNCWMDGGHMDPNELACTNASECTPQLSCQDLGYPAYFSCDYNGRCIPNP